jgi:hypothetical protein
VSVKGVSLRYDLVRVKCECRCPQFMETITYEVAQSVSDFSHSSWRYLAWLWILYFYRFTCRSQT